MKLGKQRLDSTGPLPSGFRMRTTGMEEKRRKEGFYWHVLFGAARDLLGHVRYIHRRNVAAHPSRPLVPSYSGSLAIRCPFNSTSKNQ
ncbi:hypothetical protein SLA2020_058680 [Shorea laevis]